MRVFKLPSQKSVFVWPGSLQILVVFHINLHYCIDKSGLVSCCLKAAAATGGLTGPRRRVRRAAEASISSKGTSRGVATSQKQLYMKTAFLC